MHPQQQIRQLAQHVRLAALPHLGAWRSRRVTGLAASGDATFDIDLVAEQAIEQYIARERLPVAYYSEDRGLIHPAGSRPEGLLIIDPIDGTRGAIAGLESCVVSVAWAAYSQAPRLRDVEFAAIVEIKSGRSYAASRGEGVSIQEEDGTAVAPFLMPEMEIDAMGWSLEAVGAPMEELFRIVGPLANISTVKGGFFILNSSAFELTRIASGQLAAVVDVRTRLLRERPELRERFKDYGGGRLLSLYGYDVAAAALIVQEAGAIVTDAWGESLQNWPLLDTSESNFGSLIAASSRTLHGRILQEIDTAFHRGG